MSRRKYEWDELEVGDSMFVAGQRTFSDDPDLIRASQSLRHYKKTRGLQFRSSNQTIGGVDGMIVERTA